MRRTLALAPAPAPAPARHRGEAAVRRALAPTLLCAAALLGGCGSTPPPDWQMRASGAMERYQQAWLAGATRAADAEFSNLRGALAATGQASLVARAELTRCALQVAALDIGPCPGFELLRADAAAAEQAYADYLAGQALDAARVALLPPAQRRAAQGGNAQAVRAIEDPLSRLVAAGVLVRRGQGSPELLALAADTASAQGWKRPLLAWLGAQAIAAQQRGDADEAQRLRRRMDLVGSAR